MAVHAFRRSLPFLLGAGVAVLGLVWLGVSAAAGTGTPPAALGEAQRARLVLDRLGFGPRPGDVERVLAMGVPAWIDRQLHPERIDDAALAPHLAGLTVPGTKTADLLRRYPNPTAVRQQLQRGKGVRDRTATDADEADRAQLRQQLAQKYREDGLGRPQEIYLQLAADRLLRATYSERQLQEQMVDFWSNHFNVYARKNVSQWLLPAFDREAIRPHAMGKFRDLLLATARSPAMLYYLDNVESVSPTAGLAEALSGAQAEARGPRMRADPPAQLAKRLPTGINENYARELMELHTLGVDGGYTQQDIREVARCFTGWTVADPRGHLAYAEATADSRLASRLRRQAERLGQPEAIEPGSFYFNARLHDPGVKVVLGQRISAGGMQDGIAVIDLLARQPATARFIAGKLAVKFVGDHPDPALVARVAEAFRRSDGDIRTTLAALFSDPAFFAPENYRAKIKTPFELVVSSLRALDADSNGREIQALLADLGQPLYGFQAPTGYPDTADEWVNAGAVLKRMNFAMALAANRVPGTRVDLGWLGRAGDPQMQLDAGLDRLLGADVAAATRATLRRQLAQPLPDARLPDEMADGDADLGDDERPAGALARNLRTRLLPASGDPVHVQVTGLILGSPEFQRQ